MAQFAPPPMGPRRAQSISDLIMHQGDIAARGAANSGAIWGGVARDLGQIAGGAFQQHSENKRAEQEKAVEVQRGESLARLASSDVWETDPKAGFGESVRILGPEKGSAFAKARMTAGEAQKVPDPEAKRKLVLDNLGVIASGFKAAGPTGRRLLYPLVQEMLTGAGLKDLPPEWDESNPENMAAVEQIIQGFAPGETEKPETPTIRDFGGYTASIDPATGEELWRKAKTPPPKAPASGPVPEDVRTDIQGLPSSWRDFNASHVTRDDFSVRGGQKAGAIAYANSVGRVLPTKKQAAATIAAKSTLADIGQARKLLAKQEVADWLGRYQGTLTDFLSKGWAGDEQVPQPVRQFRANLNRLAAEERHRLYGSALTAIESKFAAGFLPAITQPPSQIGSSLQEFVDDIERGMQAMWGSGAEAESSGVSLPPLNEASSAALGRLLKRGQSR